MPFADGTVHTLSTTRFPILDARGNLSGLGSINTDITQRKITEELLRDSHGQLKVITDAVPALIAYIDKDQIYRFVNKTFTDWYDRPADTIIGKSVTEIIQAETAHIITPRVISALAGNAIEFEGAVSYGDGQVRQIRGSYIPHVDENGEIAGCVVLILDVSEQKSLESKLREARAG